MNDNHSANSQPIPAQPKNYLAESILVTLFCCMPCGIVGIVKAASVGSLYSQGRYQEAQDASLSAKKMVQMGLYYRSNDVYINHSFVYYGIYRRGNTF